MKALDRFKNNCKRLEESLLKEREDLMRQLREVNKALGVIGSRFSVQNRTSEAIDFIAKNPGKTAAEIAGATGVQSAVVYRIAKEGKIASKGTQPARYWPTVKGKVNVVAR